MSNYTDTFSRGLIAGGMVDGTINIWDPSKLSLTDEDALLASVEQQHQGAISGLHFNPHADSSHLLASGGSDAEVYVMSLERYDEPTVFIPAPPPANAKHTADITQVAWNSQVVHILASAAQNGSTIIWDLRQKRAWCELRDPAGGVISDIAWNPDQGLHFVTASGDDKNPVLKLWDLRSSTSLPLATLQGHTEGILSISWCPVDTSLLLSCGKDNRTIMWDLFTLQPVYELPVRDLHDYQHSQHHHASVYNARDSNAFGSLASSASSKRYHVSWASPALPAVVSASSFDRKIQFYSLTGARSKNGRAPKWLRRPVGACFGFGGKFVVIENIQTSGGQNQLSGSTQGVNKKNNIHFGRLKIFQVSENPELTQSSDTFHECYTKGKLKEFCQLKAAKEDLSSKQIWSLMNVIGFGDNPREELLAYLGFDSAKITELAQLYLQSKQSKSSNVETEVVPSSTSAASTFDLTVPNPPTIGFSSFSSNVNAADVFSSEPTSPLPPPPLQSIVSTSIPANPPPTPAKSDIPISLSNMTADQLLKVQDLLSVIQAGEEAESTILNAIIVGNFELAVDCCLSAGLLAEALLLCQCGGPELRARTQAAYFEKQRLKHPFLNVLHAVIKNQLMEFVLTSNLLRWQETMAMLSTYGKSEEFPSLCETLANRLEKELNDKHNATLCYMCASNVPRVVQFWTEELDIANAKLGKIDTLALQDYVEKILIFIQANPVEKLPIECGRYFADYAELLANQGRLNQAMAYLKGDSLPVAILLDRLYQAGNKPAGSRPPPFPFQRVAVDATLTSNNATETIDPRRGVVAANNTQDVFGANPRGATSTAKVVQPTQQAGSSSSNRNNTFNQAASTQPGYGGQQASLAQPQQVQPQFQQQQHQQQQQQQQSQFQQPVASTAAKQQQGLPAGWIQLLDPTTNLFYYVNQATGHSQWEPPAAVPEPVVSGPSTYSIDTGAHVGYGSNVAPVSPHKPAVVVQQDIAFPNALAANPLAATNTTSPPIVTDDSAASKYQATPDTDSVVALGQLIEAMAGKDNFFLCLFYKFYLILFV
jgi:protein transport protein SEC31